MISNIMDNYFINTGISPSIWHYHTSLFSLLSLIYLQYLRHDDNGIFLTLIIATHMIRKGKLTYQLSIPINAFSITNTEVNSLFVNAIVNRIIGIWNRFERKICCFLGFPLVPTTGDSFFYISGFLHHNSSHHAAQNNPSHGTKISWHFLFLIWISLINIFQSSKSRLSEFFFSSAF